MNKSLSLSIICCLYVAGLWGGQAARLEAGCPKVVVHNLTPTIFAGEVPQFKISITAPANCESTETAV